MRSRLIVVPYLLGVEGASMGAGPLALQDAVADVLGPVRVERLKLDDEEGTEVGRCFELNRRLAVAVADARAAGEVPVVLTGNCHSQQAVVPHAGDHGGRWPSRGPWPVPRPRTLDASVKGALEHGLS